MISAISSYAIDAFYTSTAIIQDSTAAIIEKSVPQIVEMVMEAGNKVTQHILG